VRVEPAPAYLVFDRTETIVMPQPPVRPVRRPRRARLMRVINVPMRLLLRLPAATPLSGQLMLLSFTGRRTGKAYQQPVSYVPDGDTLLTPGGGTWKLNLQSLEELNAVHTSLCAEVGVCTVGQHAARQRADRRGRGQDAGLDAEEVRAWLASLSGADRRPCGPEQLSRRAAERVRPLSRPTPGYGWGGPSPF
jgi:hypothetical protein